MPSRQLTSEAPHLMTSGTPYLGSLGSGFGRGGGAQQPDLAFPAQAVRLAPNVDGCSVVQEAVEDCAGDHGIAEDITQAPRRRGTSAKSVPEAPARSVLIRGDPSVAGRVGMGK